MLVLATIACVSRHLHLRSMLTSNQSRVALAVCNRGCELRFWRWKRILLGSWTGEEGGGFDPRHRERQCRCENGEIESSHPQYVHGARTHKAVQNT